MKFVYGIITLLQFTHYLCHQFLLSGFLNGKRVCLFQAPFCAYTTVINKTSGVLIDLEHNHTLQIAVSTNGLETL